MEDDQLIAEDHRHHVTTLGYEVVGVADSGEDAVALADALRPGLVLMDVRLSGSMNGLEAGSAIAQSVGAAVVYVTATPVPDRMRYYVPKPFLTSTVASVIVTALDGTHLP